MNSERAQLIPDGTGLAIRSERGRTRLRSRYWVHFQIGTVTAFTVHDGHKALVEKRASTQWRTAAWRQNGSLPLGHAL